MRIVGTIVSLLMLISCAHAQTRAPSSYANSFVPISFPFFKNIGQYPTVPCSIGIRVGHCILDTGANTSEVSVNPTTNQFTSLYKSKSTSAYGERINYVVQVPELKLGDYVVKKNFPAVRSNGYHDLPEYLAVIGADILLGMNFIFHLGKDEADPAQLILDPDVNGVEVLSFLNFGQMALDKQFISIHVSIGGERIEAIWDTHFGWTGFSKKFINSHPRLFKKIGSQKNVDAAKKDGIMHMYELLQPVCITPDTCVMPTTNVMDFEIQRLAQDGTALDVIIGNNLIWQFSWYFDFKNQRFAIQSR